MRKFLSKKQVFFVILFVLVGVAILFSVGFEPPPIDTSSPSQDVDLRKTTGDFFAPTSLIEKPEARTWQNRTFPLVVFDEDLETGLDLDFCTFETCSYSLQGEEFCSGTIARACSNKTSPVTVGKDIMMCRFEGRNACEVFVGAMDDAGNIGSFSQSYHIDFTPPEVGRVVLSPDFAQQEGAVIIEQNKEYALRVVVRDNVELRGCWLYGGGVYLKPMILETDCVDNCIASATFNFGEESSLRLVALCTDLAGNPGQGEVVEARANQPPVVQSCRVNPAQGVRDTEFQFSATAVDPDKDLLVFVWEFGDGSVQEGQEVSHRYFGKGTYAPKVTVYDEKGLSVECRTAWTVVEE